MALGGLFGDDDAGKPREFNLSNPFFGATLDRTKGPDFMRVGASGPLLDLQRQLIERAGLFGGSPSSPIAGQAGADFLTQLAQMGGATPRSLSGTSPIDPTITGSNLGSSVLTDPMEVARQQYGLLSPILNKEFERQGLGLESRLHQQGRLGSSGTLSGQADIDTLLGAQNDARNRLLFDSFNQGLGAQAQQFGQAATADQSQLARQQGLFGQQLQGANQIFGQNATIADLGFNQDIAAGNQLFNFGTGLSQLDPQLQGLFSSLSAQDLANALGIQNTATSTFSAAAGSQGVNPGGGGIDAGGLLQAGLINAATGGLGGYLETLGKPA